jgi:hypothetical protein
VSVRAKGHITEQRCWQHALYHHRNVLHPQPCQGRILHSAAATINAEILQGLSLVCARSMLLPPPTWSCPSSAVVLAGCMSARLNAQQTCTHIVIKLSVLHMRARGQHNMQLSCWGISVGCKPRVSPHVCRHMMLNLDRVGVYSCMYICAHRDACMRPMCNTHAHIFQAGLGVLPLDCHNRVLCAQLF